jgi:hypothetical protein
MYYMAIKYIGAYNEKANFSVFPYKSITSHYLTNIETKPFWFHFLHGHMIILMVLDLLFQGIYHYYWAWYQYNHLVMLVIYHYNYIYKSYVAHNKQWLLLQHVWRLHLGFSKSPTYFWGYQIFTLFCMIHLSKAFWSSCPDNFLLKGFWICCNKG